MAGLETIEELDPIEWDTSTDAAFIKKWRGYAKASHTKSINKLRLALRIGENQDEIRVLRQSLVREFEEFDQRHQRYLQFSVLPPEGAEEEAEYLKEVTERHQDFLKMVDDALKPLGVNPPSIRSRGNRSTSNRSSSSSSRSRLLEAERKEKEAELQLNQAKLELERRAREDARLAELEAQRMKAQRDIDNGRRIRALEANVEQTKLNNAIIRQQVAEEDGRSSTISVSGMDLLWPDDDAVDRSRSNGAAADSNPLQDPRSLTQDPNSWLASARKWNQSTSETNPASESATSQVTMPSTLPPLTEPVTSGPIRSCAGFSPTLPPLTEPVTSGPIRSCAGFSPFLSHEATPVTSGPNRSCAGAAYPLLVPTEPVTPGPYRSCAGSARPPPPPMTSATVGLPSSWMRAKTDFVPQRPTIPGPYPGLMAPTYTTAPLLPPEVAPQHNPLHGLPTGTIPKGQPPLKCEPKKTEGKCKLPIMSAPLSLLDGPSAPQPDLPPELHDVPAYIDRFPDPPEFYAPLPPVRVTNPPAFSPDAWIFHEDASPPGLARLYSRPPKTELTRFDGNPKAWPIFIQAFKVQVHDTCQNDAERLIHLRNCLSPDIQYVIGETPLPGMYQEALKQLRRRYGNPRVVAAACSASLLRLETFKDGDFEGLRRFSATLRSVVATLRISGYSGELYANSTLSHLESKLPPLLRSKWGEVSYRITDRLPNVSDFDDWLDEVTIAESCVQFFTPPTSSFRPKPSLPDPPKRTDNRRRSPQVFNAVAPSCPSCNASHTLDHCKRFKGMAVEKRATFAKAKNRCYRCLEDGHLSGACSRTTRCGVDGCEYKHHPLLHGAPRMHARKPKVGEKSEAPPISFAGTASTVPDHYVTMLPIVEVVVHANNKSETLFALLDSGSEVTMIREDVARKLKLKGPSELTRISTFHSQDPAMRTRRVGFNVSSLDHSAMFLMEQAYTVRTLNLNKRPVNWRKAVRDWPHLNGLPTPSSSTNDVALLIGADHPAAHQILESRSDAVRKRAPRAIRTPFGWCVIGPLRATDADIIPQCNSLLRFDAMPEAHFQGLVRGFFDADGFGANPLVKPPIGKENQRAVSVMENTIRFLGDRYEAGLPWRTDDVVLPSNRAVALRRFINLERRLIADKQLGERYKGIIDEYLSLQHARKLTLSEIEDSPAGRTWYLPHHPVFNPNKPAKVRVVFDGSAAHQGMSLNDCLLKGPDYLSSLPGVLLRFREHPVALSADIIKMFLQVRVATCDGPAFRFIWRPPGSTEPPADYQMQVQIFGAASSPFVCASTLRQAAKDCGEHSDIVYRHVVDHFYVDNWLASFRSDAEAIKHAMVVTAALKRGGFELSQWGSSSPKVMKSLPGTTVNLLKMDLDELPVERTLGLVLDFSKDVFVLKVRLPTEGRTKRELLRATASVFDPLGFLAPLLLTAKSLIQDICRKSVNWDDELDQDILRRWKTWCESLAAIENLSLKRCLTPINAEWDRPDLHIFVDASEIGFGAASYLRFETSAGIHVSLVMAKSRVAPVKYVSIPRLELCAAVMGTRLAETLRKELRIPIGTIFYWSDSTTVLRWINSSTCRFHVFVGNRVGEILESSLPSQWRYVPTDVNPADDCSRGLPAEILEPNHRYFNGPYFLKLGPECWPQFPAPSSPEENEADPEIRAVNWTGAHQLPDFLLDKMIARSSRPNRLPRQMAYVLRWISNARKPKGLRFTGDLHADEIKHGHWWLLRHTQISSFPAEMEDLKAKREIPTSSSLVKLSPYLDHRDLMCVGGRIDHAPLPLDVRHPVILPATARYTQLIIHELHVRNAHSSTERTLHELRNLYWVPKGRSTVRRVINRCFRCKRMHAPPLAPMMAALPSFRLQHHQPAFTNTAVDYFGPIEVIIFRRKVKRWGCLFTCLSSRAVHLEMAYALDTDGFLSALFRFESRRGTPAAYYSDNGTNFVGAVRELSECVSRLDHSKLTSQLATRGTKWVFNPPASPHFGGSWERLVRSAKIALVAILGNQTLTDEVLLSALTQAENLLNGRPLTYVSVNSSDPEALTPNHLLLGRTNSGIAPDTFDERDMSFKKRWRFTQTLADHFWRRWMREYAPNLTERRKWFRPQRNLKIDDVVVIIDPTTPRGQWPLGRVVEVFTGSDSAVRSARVRTSTSTYHRPAVKLCLLETEDEEDASASRVRRAGDVPNCKRDEASASSRP